MKLISPLFLLLIVATLTVAQMPTTPLPNFAHWSAKELRGYEKPLVEKTGGPNKTAGIKLADYGSSNVAISHREANGLAEIHAHMDDYFVVQSGAARLRIGGEVVNPKTGNDPRETTGESIKGGETKTLLPGDVVHIPAKMPHQLMVENGKKFTYFVIKVKVE
jgi:mannose-6-phosphate isomerase-like protein (cupin superfamily)